MKVVPPCVLLTFQPSAATTSGVSTSQRASKVSATQSRSSASKKQTKAAAPAKGSKPSASKNKSQTAKGAANGGQTLEQRVDAVIGDLAGDMADLQADDSSMVSRLEVLEAHEQQLQAQHPADAQKRDHAQATLEALLQAIDDMKGRDKADVDELAQMSEQLAGDVDAASADLEALLGDTKDLNGYISDKSGETYDSANGSVASRHMAIRKFLLGTLQTAADRHAALRKENDVLRKKVAGLRDRARSKFLDNDGASDEEINGMLREYEELLDQHAEVFKQLDEEANASVDEFDKHGDLWKRLFTEGMDLEKRCDDVDYEIEGLSDKEGQLRRLKGELEANYADYIGKLRYVTEQQKGILDDLRNDINSLRAEIASLKSQQEQGAAELKAESVAHARGRNTKSDPGLENIVNDFVGVHQEKRRVQDSGDKLYDEWVDASKGFLNNAHGEYTSGSAAGANQRDRGASARVQELMEQLFQSNHDIEQLLADLQRIERESGINEHRTTLCTDMTADLADVRSRLDYELAQRERSLVELREYATGDQREQFDALITEIQELRAFLRQRWNDQQAELDELKSEIDSLKEKLRSIISEINELRILIIEEEHHNDIKRNLLRNRDEYIERLKIAIAQLENQKPEPPRVEFVPIPGDDIDALLAEKLRAYGCNIPLTRLGGGFYLFGTRKIFAKIMNGKLVVRVGGGYMVIDEFLATYSDMELIRINKMLENEGVDVYEELKVYKKYKDENPEAFRKIDPNRRTIIKSPTNKMKVSERGRF